MNPKQTIPAIAKIAPPLLIGVVIFMAVKSLFFDDDTEKKPETTPANTEPENRRKEVETTPTNQNFRQISAEIPAKPAIVPVYSAPAPVFPPVNIPASVAKPVIKTVAQTTPPPLKKNFVTRKTLGTVFDHGARALTRKDAVAILNRLGFGKTAAYAALSENGRFSAWLRFSPDGIITWTDR
jgi:hypothetical protein